MSDQSDIAALRAQVADLERTAKPTAPAVRGYGTPHVRKGENPLSSRPFYVSRAAESLLNKDDRNAKQEVAASNFLKSALRDHGGNYASDTMLLPMSWALLPAEIANAPEMVEVRKGMAAAVAGMDEGEIRRQVGDTNAAAMFRKAPMSSQDQAFGGAMIAPPEFGELIPILRNKSVLTEIGCRIIALPPQGTIQFPRQTSATAANYLPENPANNGTETDVGTDDLILGPKAISVFCRASNQSLRFSQGTMEALIRTDMMEQIQLFVDKAGLEGVRGPNGIQGIINTSGITRVTAKTTGSTNVGDTWTPVDVTRMIAAAMAVNSDVKAWVMAPGTWLGITETRSTGGPTAGVQDGGYLYDLIRNLGQSIPDLLRGRPVKASNQVSRVRTKGTANTLTYILGLDPDEIVLAMHGAVELSINSQETGAYLKNQSLLRVIAYADVGVRRPAGVTLMDQLTLLSL